MLKRCMAYAPLVASVKESATYQSINSSVQKFSALLDGVVALSQQGKNSEATDFTELNIIPITDALQKNIDSLIQINIDQANSLGAGAQKSYNEGFAFVVIIIVISMIATITLAALLTRSIVTPLKDLLAANDKVSAGDLRDGMVISGKDEFTELQRSTLSMQMSLRKTIGLIANSSLQLASAAAEMNSITAQSSDGLGRQNQEIEQTVLPLTEN